MIVSAKAIIAAELLGKWVKVSQEEIDAIVDSIPGENLVRANTPGHTHSLRYYVRNGYICVTMQEADIHPDDLPAAAAAA